MIATSTIAAHLTSLLGSEQVREEANIITAAPADTQQISTLLSYANQHQLTIAPIGGGTKQSWGNPTQPNPTQTNIRLELHRLNRVLEHPWQDLTCTVQAGCTWSTLQQTLAQHNQFVALDPLWPHRATVGGIVATNDSGALRHRYGSLRDLIIGMTIVLADGTLAKTGGKVVKNVAGYDLHKLMTGAFGTLGIIAEVTFRLHPLPLHAQTFTVAAPQAAQLAPLIAAIRDSHLLTQALQLRGNSHGFHLDIQLNAHPDANQPTLLAAMLSETGLSPNSAAEPIAFASEIDLGFSPGIESPNKPGFSPRDTHFTARESLFQPNATIVKLPVEPSELCEYLDHLKWAPNIEVSCVAQSFGVIYTSLEGTATAIEDYLKTIKADYTILATLANVERWKANPNARPLMQSIKHQFDPNHILNPNRLLGGT